MTSPIHIASGVKILPLDESEDGRVLVHDLIPKGGGTYQAVARIHARNVRLTQANLKAFGIEVSYLTLRRLIAAGFVKGSQPTPGVHLMDLASYFQHDERTAADPEFWTRDSGANAKKFRSGMEGTSLGNGREYKQRKKGKKA